jgi:hypothetical protein
LSPSTRYITGTSFTPTSLRAQKKVGGIITTGRSLHTAAQKGVANGKKALAFATHFLDSSGNLPSGTSDKDLYNFVLQQMYKSWKATKVSDENNCIDLDDAEDSVVSSYPRKMTLMKLS